MSPRILHALASLSLLACTAEPDPSGPDAAPDVDVDASVAPDAAPVTNVAGRHDHTLVVDGLEREVIIYVPELAAGTAPAPVVMMLHGTSGDGERFYGISGWREQADETGLIAVFPSALTHCFFEDENGDGDFADAGERKVTTKWASGALGTATKPLCTPEEIARLSAENQALVDHPLADDLAYVDAILALLDAEYAVDAARIYVTGFSNGGQMSSRLAAERADRFAAAAAAAGFLDVEPAPAARPLSLVASVGTLDDRLTVPLGVDEIPISATLLDDFPVFAAVLGELRAVLQLDETYTYAEQVVSGKRVGTFTFATSTAGADNTLTFALIEDAYHVYPNGENHPLVMASGLWTFFAGEALAP
jgi:polyhydroxybutyrate depolymerase